jgi:hypothetical protein
MLLGRTVHPHKQAAPRGRNMLTGGSPTSCRGRELLQTLSHSTLHTVNGRYGRMVAWDVNEGKKIRLSLRETKTEDACLVENNLDTLANEGAEVW